MKLEGGRHRDTTQVKGLSPEITNVSAKVKALAQMGEEYLILKKRTD